MPLLAPVPAGGRLPACTWLVVSITTLWVTLSLQVVICHNHMASQDEINHALVHELVHAFDHCRGANIDWSICNHHACSEVGLRIVCFSSPGTK